MHRIRTHFPTEKMMRRRIAVVLVLVVVMLTVSGCAQSTAQSAPQDAPTATAVPQTPPPTAEPQPTPTEVPTTVAEAPTTGQPTAGVWAPVVGASLSDFELQGVDGQTYTAADFAGKAMVLNFWATWCPHCRSELPTFQQVYEQRANDGFVLVAVSVNEAPDVVKAVVDEEGLEFPVLLDSTGAVGSTYQVRGIPASYFVDRNGIIRGSHVGAITDAESLNKVIDALLE